MTIVLNEHEWAEEMIRTRSLGTKPFETLVRVAKYYIDKNYSKKDVRAILDSYLIQCEPTASLSKWSDTLDSALTRALKYNTIDIDYIDITKREIEKISALDGKQLQRLAFTLLCLAKYWNAVNSHSDFWVNCKDSDIMKMANINTSIKRQSLMYRQLNELGMIQFSKKIDNTNVRVCFAENGESAIQITDFRNLGYQYHMNTGSRDYFQCQNCGIVTRKKNVAPKEMPQPTGRPQKYCRECAAKIRVQQNVDAVMRYENRRKGSHRANSSLSNAHCEMETGSINV